MCSVIIICSSVQLNSAFDKNGGQIVRFVLLKNGCGCSTEIPTSGIHELISSLTEIKQFPFANCLIGCCSYTTNW
ncbi:hypothetical protein KHA80_16215 [Anaerobacillus sp. HL2]|nr:hypothetical protein KHA80_16215 [Anaerobacillus sp. HL2]